MNADVEKAVEASRSPRVDALIERVMQEHPGFGASAQARYYEAVHQELAPLARDQEAEIARLQSASDMRFQQAMENGQRAQQAEALLRSCNAACRRVIAQDGGILGGIDFNALGASITTHLSENSRG